MGDPERISAAWAALLEAGRRLEVGMADVARAFRAIGPYLPRLPSGRDRYLKRYARRGRAKARRP